MLKVEKIKRKSFAAGGLDKILNIKVMSTAKKSFKKLPKVQEPVPPKAQPKATVAEPKLVKETPKVSAPVKVQPKLTPASPAKPTKPSTDLKQKLTKIYKANENRTIELLNLKEIIAFLDGLPSPGSTAYKSLNLQLQGVINLAFHKAESAARLLVVDSDLTGKARFEISQFSKTTFPSNFQDLVQHLADVWGHRPDQAPQLTQLFELLLKSNIVGSQQKLLLTLKLYNSGDLTGSTIGFETIASDPGAEWKDRVECAKFLLLGDDADKHSLAQEVLCELIVDPATLPKMSGVGEDEGSRSSASSSEEEADFSSSEDSTPDFLKSSPSASEDDSPVAALSGDDGGDDVDESPSTSEGDFFTVKKRKIPPEKLAKRRAAREAAKRKKADELWQHSTQVRYGIIADFLRTRRVARVDKRGGKRIVLIPAIFTSLVKDKLRPSEVINLREFVLPVVALFVRDQLNHVRQRIMAASVLYESKQDDLVAEARDLLLKVGKDVTLEEDVRADALDFIRTRALAQKNKADLELSTKLLMDLGSEASASGNITIAKKVKTIYENSQNVHDDLVSDAIMTFINDMDENKDTYSFSQVESDIAALYQTWGTSSDEVKKARSAIYRCSIDHSTFGQGSFTVKKIFCYIWTLVQDFRDLKLVKTSEKTSDAAAGEKPLKGRVVADLLERRFVDALIEMGDTCTTGHVARLAQVMQGYGVDVKISFKQQIKANVSGRIGAMVRDETDEAMVEALTLGVLEDADKEIKDKYEKWMKVKLEKLKIVLWKEFSAHVKKADFEEAFAEAAGELLA